MYNNQSDVQQLKHYGGKYNTLLFVVQDCCHRYLNMMIKAQNKKIHKGYYPYYEGAAKELNITPEQLIILMIINSSKNKESFASLDYLSSITGLKSISQVRQQLDDLVRRGFVVKTFLQGRSRLKLISDKPIFNNKTFQNFINYYLHNPKIKAIKVFDEVLKEYNLSLRQYLLLVTLDNNARAYGGSKCHLEKSEIAERLDIHVNSVYNYLNDTEQLKVRSLRVTSKKLIARPARIIKDDNGRSVRIPLRTGLINILPTWRKSYDKKQNEIAKKEAKKVLQWSSSLPTGESTSSKEKPSLVLGLKEIAKSNESQKKKEQRINELIQNNQTELLKWFESSNIDLEYSMFILNELRKLLKELIKEKAVSLNRIRDLFNYAIEAQKTTILAQKERIRGNTYLDWVREHQTYLDNFKIALHKFK